MSSRKKRGRTKNRKRLKQDPKQTRSSPPLVPPEGHTVFRLVAWQPLSLVFETKTPFELTIQQIKCRLAVRPEQADEPTQRTRGGSLVSIDFHLPVSTDLLQAVHRGIDLIEDFLSAVALVEGATLRGVEPLQMARTDTPPQYTFVGFLPIAYNHWDRPVPTSTLQQVCRLVAHWDGLETGIRLRRAARHFSQAIGAPYDLTAFQHAYMGLEAMEKPLAQAMGIPPGVEQSQGKCANCDAVYTRRRTALSGVRAYVHGDIHPDTTSPQRKKEWTELNRLRQDLFHGLDDTAALEGRARDVLPMAMHTLHDAICCQSHAHDLESRGFRLARGTRRVIAIGDFTASELGPLEEWMPLRGTREMQWVQHVRHHLVPEFRLENSIPSLRTQIFWLEGPLSLASEAHLEPAQWESG